MNDQALGRMRGVAPCALTIGDLILRSPEDAGALPARQPMLLVPLSGAAAGTPLLHVGAPATLPPATGLIVQFRTHRLNAEASRLLGDGRRLATVLDHVVLAGDDRLLERAVEDLLFGSARHCALEAGFYRALAQRIVARQDRDSLVVRMRAVSEAIRLVRAEHRQAFDVERLASMVGVTADTLRKGFRACLGMTVGAFIQSVRLDWAFARLSDLRECRSIAELAVAAGFSGGQNFSRHYVRRFAETPTQTRFRAVRMAN
ncbi:HTH-type transcriptional activator RhaR [Sphingomonas sp. S2M10]|uniref:AraC family transcriptional regulator n=1 Tax=Sphingomonas sp. S2M10 TaxID=2705010 RepID=UPI00145703BC|nr:helix-turn-helix domain-containing protein [Sphingomonas sp. S2M10]NLS28473.1 HTH-type transcriptional activator RhaR [Sphingomonas sp. S2M10]